MQQLSWLQKEEAIADLLSPPAVHTYATIAAYRSEPRTSIHFGPGEEFILHRLDREKRHGRIELLDNQTCRFIADVYDASEMLPWIRTFIGRIVDLQCSNKFVVKTFNDDLRHMEAIYGGETDAV